MRPSEERVAAALEAAGLNPYALLEPRAVAPTPWPEVGVALGHAGFSLLSVEEVPVPALDVPDQEALHDAAVALALRWGLAWRGVVEAGRVQVAFGGRVRFGPDEDPEVAGLRLLDAALAVHAAHVALRQRVVNAAWRRAPLPLPTTAPA